MDNAELVRVISRQITQSSTTEAEGFLQIYDLAESLDSTYGRLSAIDDVDPIAQVNVAEGSSDIEPEDGVIHEVLIHSGRHDHDENTRSSTAPKDSEGDPREKLRVAFLVANEGIEQVELETPWNALLKAGAEIKLIAPKPGEAQAMNHLDKADSFQVDETSDQADPETFDAVVLPGGVANPDQLRMDGHSVDFVKAISARGRPVAAICHGPWTLTEGDLVRGRTLTSWPSLETDISNAGGSWVDEEVHICTEGPNTLITSPKPDDLAAFSDALIEAFYQRRAQ